MRQPATRVYTLVLAGALALSGMGTPQTARADDVETWPLAGNAVFPEGIAVQTATGRFFTGSTGDGTIYVGDVDDPGATEIWQPGGTDGLTFAVGMKASASRLYVSGGGSGNVFVYNTGTKALLKKVNGGLAPTFINDVALAPNGDAYFTDSLSPAIYRLSADLSTFERWTDFAGSALVYASGFNLNGIAVTPDGANLIVVQSNTGKLWRISVATKVATEINIGGAVVTGGDGILLSGRTLWVMRNAAALLLGFRMSADWATATLHTVHSDAAFQFPTTFGKAGDRFLVVNSQFDKRGGTPALPFNVAGIEIPEGGEGRRFDVTLLGANEVAGGDPDGSGRGRIRLNTARAEVCFDVRVEAIALPAVGMHIHRANAGVNGPIVVDPDQPPGADGRSKVCTPAAASLINAIWSNPAGYYLNVHTTDFRPGALRGQLVPRPGDDD